MLSLNDPPRSDPIDNSLTGSRGQLKPIEALSQMPYPERHAEPSLPPVEQVVKVKFGSIFWPIVCAWFFCGIVSAILYAALK